ncbi:type II toxin-antitoxin system VapC family toxin [Chengkuizengella sp. SCS-71B]|uniref:type II toxin-antitoxin system VapC family toxin n=1 Tax=Chengkuizengella sp. SCS-71B TaxID=3115290 RepID=UPI0032C2340F
MKRYLIDTNIVRFYIQGNTQVETFMKQCEVNDDILLISMVTVGELRSQLIEINSKHRPALRRLIKTFPKIEVTDPEDKKAHAYRRMARKIRAQHQKEKKPYQPKLPGLADSKIAVDAINEQLDIITNNTKDFQIARFFGISLYDPIRNLWYYPIKRRLENHTRFILPNEKYT